METIITPEQRHEMFSWLRGGDTTSNPEMEDRFIDTLAVLVRERIDGGHQPAPVQRPRHQLYQDKPHPLSLKAIMQEVTGDPNYELPRIEIVKQEPESVATPETAKPQEQEKPSGIDSVVIARTIINMAATQGHSINMTQLQAILYITYGVYLAQKGERLIEEHPQMWEYGPVFPRAYNKVRKEKTDGQAESDSLKAEHPDIWNFLSESFSRYAWTTGSVLVAPHTASGSPWAKTRKANPEKWGAVIDDALISEWFEKRVASPLTLVQ